MGEEEGQQSTGSKVAGTLFHVLTGFWMVIAYCGWAISLAGLAALQNYVNSDANNAGPNGWSIPANYPSLSAGEQFRFDWFVLFLELVVLILLTISVATRLLEETRAAMIGFLSVATTLLVISTDRFYNIGHWRSLTGNSQYHASRAAFAGYLISATGNFALIYQIGLQRMDY